MAISLPIVSEWNPSGLNKAVADFKKLETTGEKAAFAIKKAALPAAAAVAGLGVAAFGAVKAFAEDDAAAQKLATTITNVTGATGKQIDAVEDFISKTSIAAAVSDDELRPALDSLVRGTGDVAQAQDLLGLALDISAGTGKDLTTVSDALSKAYNGNFKALKSLDPALAGLIAEGADADTVFGRLAGTFQNQASKQANTTSGKFKSMSIALEETKESIGAALLPIIEKLLPKLQSMGEFVRQNTGLIVTIGVVIGTLAAAILAVNAGLTIYNTIQALTAALNTALSASFSALWVATGAVVIIGIIAAVVALQAKFNIFGKLIDGLKAAFNAFWNVVQTVWGYIRGAFDTGFGFITKVVGTWYSSVRGYIDALYSAFKNVFNGIASIWNNTVGKLSFRVPSWVPLIGGKGFDVPDIPKLADGGIVTGPTLAMIGEAGPEAVIPLSKSGVLGGPTINVTVTSADPNAVVQALQQYVRLNNRLPANAIG
jgi:hypothetical protein